MPAKYTMESTGFPAVKRIIRDGAIVAMAMQFANGRWGAFTPDDKPMGPERFATPAAVKKWLAAQPVKESSLTGPAPG